MAEVLLENAPRKAREHFEKGMAAVERNNFDYAMDMFESALELCPALLRARMFLRISSLKKTKGSKPNPISAMFAMPAIMQIQGQLKKKPEEAVKSAEKLLRKNPLNMQVVNVMVDAAKAANMPEVAVMTLELVREYFPGDVKMLKSLGRLYQDVNRMHDARLVYEEIVRLLPGDQDALKAMKDATALDTMQRGGWNEAGSYRDMIKDTKAATRLEQESKAVKTGKDIDDLITETIEKVKREPLNINFKRALADLYAKADRFDEALAVLNEAQQGMGGADPQIERSISAVTLRRLEVQIESLEAAGDKAGADAVRQQRSDFLLQDAEERVKRYPNDLQFRYDLGVIYCEREKYNEAIQQLQQATRNPQRRTRSLYYLAICFKAKGQFDLAREQLEKAAAELGIMDDTKKDILYELGTICEAMGNRDDAANYYKEIYSVDISFRDVAQKIESFYKKT